jgi:molecular chaperone DnaK (HSP70)
MSSSRSIAAARQKRSGETVQKPQQFQSPPQQMQKQVYNQKPQMKQPQQQAAAAAPRPKLSIGDAFGLVTLRLGRVEQFMFDVQQQGGVKSGEISIPENSQVIDKSVFTNMISRLDGLEKKESNSKQLTILENELRSTKDLLISMMAKFDKFSKETDDKFKETDDKFLDYDSAIAEIEEKMDSNEETGQDVDENDALSNDLQSELIGEKEKAGISFEISE